MGGGGTMAGQLADFGPRILAFLIDFVVLIVIGAIIGLILGALRINGGISSIVVSLVIWGGYYGYMLSARNGQTVGSQLLNLRVVTADGGPIDMGKGIIRGLATYFSFLLCFIPAIVSLIMAGTSQKKQAIHDLIAGTVVVRA
jgi:uncharacterized RDD family membrane protein YckC